MKAKTIFQITMILMLIIFLYIIDQSNIVDKWQAMLMIVILVVFPLILTA